MALTQTVKLACNGKQKNIQFPAQKRVHICSFGIWPTTLQLRFSCENTD